MSDKIEPALTPEEWRISSAAVAQRFAITELRSVFENQWHEVIDPTPADLPKVIALANAALPDSDLRKITRATLDTVREATSYIARACDGESDYYRRTDAAEHEGDFIADTLAAFADALESYLPPETS